MFKSVNPATEETIAEYEALTSRQVDYVIQLANDVFRDWRRTALKRRSELMHHAAGVLREQRQALSELMTAEMGKPIAASEAEIDKCAATCDYFADHAERMLAQEPRRSDAAETYVRYDPLGPVLAVMPWNFPFWQVFRFAAPALMAGNVGLLKHASNVTGCAIAIEHVFRQAGFPDGAFSTLIIDSRAAESLVADPGIRAVTLTGSEGAGRAVGSAAGKSLKKSVLELGGSDPFIVLADADVNATARAAAMARCINTGQSCIAAKRFIVHEAIADEFEQAMTDAMAALKVGDPMDRGNDLGPLARADLLDELHDQVRRTLSAGGWMTTGGAPSHERGYYYEPTVLTHVRPGMPAFDEETFGPVAAIVRVADADEAVALANQSRFGLGASIWTADLDLARRLAADLEAGCVFINEAVKSDPRLPFGGVKASGYGRELAEAGIREFVNIKTVCLQPHKRPETQAPGACEQ